MERGREHNPQFGYHLLSLETVVILDKTVVMVSI